MAVAEVVVEQLLLVMMVPVAVEVDMVAVVGQVPE
jgi:hypothetical protein